MSAFVIFILAIAIAVLFILTLEALFSEGGEGSWKRRKS